MRHVILVLGLAACVPAQTNTLVNQGSACWADGTVTVVHEDCASSCAEIVTNECTVDVGDDGRVLVTATLEYTVPNGDCDASCQVMTTTCGADIPDGPATFVYGADEVEFIAPDDVCTGPAE